MEAYSRAGAALNATNTSFEKSAGLIAAANASVQNSSIVGTALKTISARIRKSKTDLDELGESIDDLAKPWSAYAEEIKALTGFNIMIEGSTTQFKDLYDIFDGLAKVWNDLGDNAETAQSRVAEILGGTRQYQVISSILTNWSDATNAYTDAMDAAGVSTNAMATYMDSIDGRVGKLKALFEEISSEALDGDFIKGFFDVAEILLSAVGSIIKLINHVGGLNAVLYVTASVLATIKIEKIKSFLERTPSSLKALISGIKMAVSSLSALQLGVIGLTTAIGAFLLIRNIISQQREEAAQTALTNAQNYITEAESAKKDSESLEELIEKYKAIASTPRDIWDNKTVESVKSIQEEITKLVGDQASALDLVNGKLKTELETLAAISDKQRENMQASAATALKDAEIAVQNAMKKLRPLYDRYYELGVPMQGKAYGNIKTDTIANSFMDVDVIKTDFDTAAEFAAQYEAVLAYKESLAKTLDETNATETMFYEEINKYLSEYQNVYETYISAKNLFDQINSPPKRDTKTDDGPSEQLKGLTIALKSAYDVLDEVQDGYDSLTDAMSSLTEEGYLSSKSLSNLLKLISENKLAGLALEDVLIRDANGYLLAEGALEKYVQRLIEQATVTGTFATEQDKENAISNLKTLQAVLATLVRTQNDSAGAEKIHREELEKEKTLYKDQLEAYKKLIDLRKELLQQYEDELKYKRELEKKEKKVASLQTRLTVSQLDTTSAGRAKTRQLAEELKTAQEELDDYTLEHAIDVITGELDEQYSQYENWINSQIGKVEESIDALSESNSALAGDISDSITTATQKITEAIAALELAPVVNIGSGEYFEQAQQYIYRHRMLAGDKGRWGQDPEFRKILKYLTVEEFEKLKGYSPNYETSASNGKVISLNPRSRYQIAQYHSGGLVGGSASLKPSEAFAKLLKGEFVATPNMMRKFINTTLPDIASMGKGNEFNAPLINIQCDNVTQDSLPKLKEIVNEAVNQIKRQLDGGLTRAGYKKAVNQII